MKDLTDWEIEILKMKAQGMLDKQIAAENGTVWNTVKNQLSHIYLKLGAVNATNAVYIAMQKGIFK